MPDRWRADLEQSRALLAEAGVAYREVEPLVGNIGPAGVFDLRAHLFRQREWSEKTFGPGERAEGVCDHIRKELDEIEAEPNSIEEWIDVAILALDGAWRAGHSPDEIIAALAGKHAKNEARLWPDWRTVDPGKAVEHIRDIPLDRRDEEHG